MTRSQWRTRAVCRNEAVDQGLRTPLYHQIFLILRDRIRDGTYGPKQFIPSEQEICTTFGVSRITAKRALDELARSGLVTRLRGRGTRVSGRKPAPAASRSAGDLLDRLPAGESGAEIRLTDFCYIPAPEEVAVALGVEPGADVQRAVRIRLLDGAAYSRVTTFVPADIGRSYDAKALAARPLLALIERGGVRVSRGEQWIGSVLADPAAASALGCEVGTALLKISRLVHDESGRAVELMVALYRPDRYQYRMSLIRAPEASGQAWLPAS